MLIKFFLDFIIDVRILGVESGLMAWNTFLGEGLWVELMIYRRHEKLIIIDLGLWIVHSRH